ncbi:MAG: hypothetical protein HQM16_03040 [Deltaproteobacteria bacterium]|nr:hypothetical protein [Deltaproteobacteria bacterium]
MKRRNFKITTNKLFTVENCINNSSNSFFSINKTYGDLQDDYMELIHLPQHNKAQIEWQNTLYEPMQRFVISLIEGYIKKNDIHLCYIGAGPYLPLFGKSVFSKKLLNTISSISFLDISNKSLVECKKKLLVIAPHINVKTYKVDITQGTGENWLGVLKNIIFESLTPEQVLVRLKAFRIESIQETDYKLNFLKSVQADIVYSEMVATFTGTAPLLAFCLAVQNNFTHSLTVKKVLRHLRALWQQYNEISYQKQLMMMYELVHSRGLVAVATDVEKILSDGTCELSTSFLTSRFPQPDFHGLNVLKYIPSEKVVWNDVIKNADDSYGLFTSASQAHKHLIDFAVYQKSED